MMDKIALALLIIGGLNWGLVGIFEFDLVAWLFGCVVSYLVHNNAFQKGKHCRKRLIFG